MWEIITDSLISTIQQIAKSEYQQTAKNGYLMYGQSSLSDH